MTRSRRDGNGQRSTWPLHIDEDEAQVGDVLVFDGADWQMQPLAELPTGDHIHTTGQMDGLVATLQGLTDEDLALQATLEEHLASLEEHEQKLEEQLDTIQAQGSQLDGCTATLQEQADELAALAGSLTALQAAAATQAELLSAQEATLSGHGAEIATGAEADGVQNATLDAHGAALSSQASGLAAVVATASGHTSQLAAQAGELASQAATLAGQASSLASLSSTLSSQAASLSTLGGTVSAHTSAIANLVTRVVALEALVNRSAVIDLPSIALLSTVEQVVNWTPALANANYRVLFGLEVPAAHLGKVNVALKKDSRTTGGCTILLSTVLAVSAGAGRLHVVAEPV